MSPLLLDIRKVMARAPFGHYQLVCHPNVFLAIQRVSDIQPDYPPHPLDRFFGADVVVNPDIGRGIWELYSNGKLVGYGRLSE